MIFLEKELRFIGRILKDKRFLISPKAVKKYAACEIGKERNTNNRFLPGTARIIKIKAMTEETIVGIKDKLYDLIFWKMLFTDKIKPWVTIVREKIIIQNFSEEEKPVWEIWLYGRSSPIIIAAKTNKNEIIILK